MARDVLPRPPDLRLRDFHGIYTVAPQMRSCSARSGASRAPPARCSSAGRPGRARSSLPGHSCESRARRRCSRRQLRHLLSDAARIGALRPLAGAFTGAVRDREGLFALADRGTLFLDEGGGDPARAARKAPARDAGEELHAGGAPARSRWTCGDLGDQQGPRPRVAEGRFREDLIYRMRVSPSSCRRCASARRHRGALLALHRADEPRRLRGSKA